MFSHEGPSRSTRKNAIVAGYLALIAGFVNAGGFVLIGSFTSHVTGTIGRLGNDVATQNHRAGAFAILLVVSFFLGAFIASLIVESNVRHWTSGAYGMALFLEGVLLTIFIFVAGLSRSTVPRVLDAEAAILCLAMGMQNSLVTRLSGTVVRTTHLTGVVTDLGIEAARWLRWQRAQLSWEHTGPSPDHPRLMHTVLLLTITAAFTIGGVAGAILTLRASRWAMLFPAVAIFAVSLYALLTPRPSKSP